MCQSIHKDTGNTNSINVNGRKVDLTKRVLIVGGDIPAVDKLLGIFPNGKSITAKTRDISKKTIEGTDYVVFITRALPHSLYWKVNNLIGDAQVVKTSSENPKLVLKSIIEQIQ